MNEFFRDIKYATRGLIRKPAFSAITVATLALGIGGNTAILTTAHTILFSPLPFLEARNWSESKPQPPDPMATRTPSISGEAKFRNYGNKANRARCRPWWPDQPRIER